MTANQTPKLSFSYARAEDVSDDIVFNFSTKLPTQTQKEKPGIPLPRERWELIASHYMREISGKELKQGKDYTVTFDPDGTGISIKMKAALIKPDRRQSAEDLANKIMQDHVSKHPELVPDSPTDEVKAAPAPQAKDQAEEITEIDTDDVKPAERSEFEIISKDEKATIEPTRPDDTGEQARNQRRELHQINKPTAAVPTTPATKVVTEKPTSNTTSFAAQQLLRKQQEDHLRRVRQARAATEQAAKLARQQRMRDLQRPTI